MKKQKQKQTDGNKSGDWWNEISEDERASINKGLRQLEQGKGILHEQVIKKYARWFAK